MTSRVSESYQVSVRLRPIRFGILADVTDENDLLDAFAFAGSFWGGTLNSVIPASPLSTQQDVEIAFRRYDPDVTVRTNRASAAIASPGHPTIHLSTPLTTRAVFAERGILHYRDYGITLSQVAHAFVDKELLFTRREPLAFVRPTVNGLTPMLHALLFGRLIVEEEAAFDDIFRPFGLSTPKIEIDGLAPLLDTSRIYPRRLSMYGLGGENSAIEVIGVACGRRGA